MLKRVGLVAYAAVTVAVLLVRSLSAQPIDSTRIVLSVVTVPKEVTAFSTFYLRVRLTNTGPLPVRGCVLEVGRIISEDPCVMLGYRFWRAPRRLDVASVDTVQVLSRREILAPGESIERNVRVVSARQMGNTQLHVYAVSQWRDGLAWTYRPVSITIREPSFEVKRREFVALALLGVYLGGLGWALVRIARSFYEKWR
jgi:hypothetical protein